MKGVLAATVLGSVLAVGGVPALALTLTAEQTTGPQPGVTVKAEQPGPPPWAHARGAERQAQKQRWKDQRRAQMDAWKAHKRDQQKAWHAEGEHQGPPPWAGGPWKNGR